MFLTPHSRSPTIHSALSILEKDLIEPGAQVPGSCVPPSFVDACLPQPCAHHHACINALAFLGDMAARGGVPRSRDRNFY